MPWDERVGVRPQRPAGMSQVMGTPSPGQLDPGPSVLVRQRGPQQAEWEQAMGPVRLSKPPQQLLYQVAGHQARFRGSFPAGGSKATTEQFLQLLEKQGVPGLLWLRRVRFRCRLWSGSGARPGWQS